MACRLACLCFVLFLHLLRHSQGAATTVTKSLVGIYRADYPSELSPLYIRDGQCHALIDHETLNVCQLVSSVTAMVTDGLPPDIKIELSVASLPRWAVKVYRTADNCAGEANVTVTVTCQN